MLSISCSQAILKRMGPASTGFKTKKSRQPSSSIKFKNRMPFFFTRYTPLDANAYGFCGFFSINILRVMKLYTITTAVAKIFTII